MLGLPYWKSESSDNSGIDDLPSVRGCFLFVGFVGFVNLRFEPKSFLGDFSVGSSLCTRFMSSRKALNGHGTPVKYRFLTQ